MTTSASSPSSAPFQAQPIPADGPFEGIEAEITELWGHISAATYRFLMLVADYDEQQGWGYHGCCSCAHWLNWRCGIGIGAAREKVRVARALKALPGISAAFAAGQISYSKARAMTRIATPENEEYMLTIALHGTAAHVEKVVRLYRRTERMEEAHEAFAAQQSRYLNYYYADGVLVIHARLPAEVGALFRRALEAAEQAMFAQARNDSAEDHSTENVSAETSPSCSTDVSIPTSASACGQNVSAETPETEATYADDPAGARRADALRYLAEHILTHPPAAGDGAALAERYQVVVHIDQGLLSDALEPNSQTERVPCCEMDDARRIAAATAKRLGCDSALVGLVDDENGEPLSVGRRTRAIPPSIKRALAARDGGCRFPGCTRTRFTEGHHVVHWADGGETKLSNLLTLCRFHHRLVHEGGYGLKRTDDGVFTFTRPDGTPLDDAGYTGIVKDARFRGNALPGELPIDAAAIAPTLERLNAEQGLDIDAQTCGTRWLGERPDYGWIVGDLIETRNDARSTHTRH